ncbi:flagellar assembly protein FliW [Saccharibacillus kuerlensis]|uniref:Flagellar assembly factor FliW n=1 Tax=Saccharibacillus kuerlensis TaxID=459527 RepID=A0ABQ2KTX9_9BACL|nr:flagellar assembly protein FliW [Saccharibacillus kuerlensis]GGN93242.1 flagellar assembly factor FliW [Saccharibacillus kuerlensis]
MIQIQSVQLGELTVSEEDLITFPKGIPGFEEVAEYVLCNVDETYSYLQAADQPEVAFIVTDPFLHFQDYEFKLSDELVEELQLSEEKGLAVRCIVTWNSDPARVTANLLAPLIFNVTDRIAKQVVLVNTTYQTKHPLSSSLSSESGES